MAVTSSLQVAGFPALERFGHRHLKCSRRAARAQLRFREICVPAPGARLVLETVGNRKQRCRRPWSVQRSRHCRDRSSTASRCSSLPSPGFAVHGQIASHLHQCRAQSPPSRQSPKALRHCVPVRRAEDSQQLSGHHSQTPDSRLDRKPSSSLPTCGKKSVRSCAGPYGHGIPTAS